MDSNEEVSLNLKELIKVNENKEISQDLSLFLKPVSKVLIPYGINKKTKEVNFALKTIEGMKITKLSTFIQELTLNLTPSKMTEKSKEFVIFSILDHETGFDGRYSLLINQNKECFIFREHYEENSIIKKFKDIDDALTFISKNLYYFEIPS